MNYEELKNQIGIEVLSAFPEDIEKVVSVEENCGSIFIEMEDGTTYSISITKTEE